jgi:hypothetical protein
MVTIQQNNHLSTKHWAHWIPKTTKWEVGNTGPSLGQVQKCGGDKGANGIPTLPSW